MDGSRGYRKGKKNPRQHAGGGRIAESKRKKKILLGKKRLHVQDLALLFVSKIINGFRQVVSARAE